jgi:ATP-dependent DNA ligase
MLCKRPTKKIEDSVKEMGGGEFIIEEKLDGERMQLHKRGNEYFYCSRLVIAFCSSTPTTYKSNPSGKAKITLICTAVMSERAV